MEKTCEACGKQYRNQNLQFCSRECFNTTRPTHATITCKHCGKPHRVRTCDAKVQKYCSRRCAWDSRIQKDAIEQLCDYCGKLFRLTTSAQRSGIVTCSPKCAVNRRTRNLERKTVTAKCIKCSREFSYKPSDYHGHKSYCSRKCYDGERNQVVCANCSTPFERPPSKVDAKYCSRKCQHEHQIKENASMWKGGRTVDHDGRVNVVTDEFYDTSKGIRKRTRRYRAEHRILVESIIGRRLEHDGEPVLHLNRDNSDNRLENLYICASRSEMTSIIMGGNPYPEHSNVHPPEYV